MSSNRLRVRDVKVCPQNVDYAAVNSDETICLYKDERLRPRAAHNHALAKPRSAQEHAQMTPIVENKKSVKLIDWYPKKDSNSLLALVHYNGRIILDKLECSLFQDKCSLYGKELISSKSTNRHCNAISWNSQQSNLLAQAFDKLNKEPSVVIWDINNIAGGGLGASGDSSAGLGGVGRHGGVGVSTSVGGGVSVPGTNHHAAHHSSSGHHHHRQVSDLSMKPIFDIAPNEIGHSIAWNPLDSNNLIAGLSHKFIRVYDIRESKPQQMTLTKAVFGLQLSPYDPMYLASHTNTEINIWDLRKFEKPVLTIPQERHIVKIEWSPEWRGVMATLTKDSQIIEIYDIKNTITVEDYDSKIIDRVIQPFKHKDVLTFTWNKTRKNCLMVLSVDGVHNISIHERKALTWSANNCISWTSERDVVNCEMEDMSRAMRTSSLLSARQWQTDDSLKLSNDISERIKQRALNDYGIQNNILDNIKRLGDFSDTNLLKNLWKWLYIAKLTSDPLPMPGIKNLLNSREVDSTSQVCDYLNTPLSSPVTKVDNSVFNIQRKIYSSKLRSKALHYCGWGHTNSEINSLTLITRLEQQGEYERAAAIAVFTLNLERALQVFKNKPNTTDSPMGLVGIALSGYSESSESIWRQQVKELCLQLDHPYLRAMFNFLVDDTNGYDSILQDEELLITDRTAFACLYADDLELNKFVAELSCSMVKQGRLDGLLLTGFSSDGIDLIRRYVDKTGDVQTAACVVCLTISSSPSPNPPSLHAQSVADVWIADYRDILDQWKLWHQRAEFDIYQNTKRTCKIINSQSLIMCNYCGKSVNIHEKPKGLSSSESRTGVKSKPISCPNCAKPMPKCSVCMLNLGASVLCDKQISYIDDWLTVCQNCGHCGHADHLRSWFSGHAECAVSGCGCRCFSLDSLRHAVMSE